MPNKNNFWTQQRPDGKWEAKREGAERASTVTNTQAEAWAYAKEHAKAEQGEALLKGRNTHIRERNTYGNDDFPPKG